MPNWPPYRRHLCRREAVGDPHRQILSLAKRLQRRSGNRGQSAEVDSLVWAARPHLQPATSPQGRKALQLGYRCKTAPHGLAETLLRLVEIDEFQGGAHHILDGQTESCKKLIGRT